MENLTALIPFRNGNSTLQRLLNSLPRDLNVLIVDDQSETPPTTDRNDTTIIRTEQRSYFAGAVNAGCAACDTDVLVLNQDGWFENESWTKLISGWQKLGYGIAGSGVFGHPAWKRGYVEGQAMYLSRAAINALDGAPMDAEFYPLWGCTALAQTRLCRLGFKAHPVRMADYGMRHARPSNAPYGESIKAALATEPDKQSLFVRTPPAISVIITCYNYGRFLTDAVNSLIGGDTSLGAFPPQTFQSFEVVIVDDASTDETREIGESLADAWKGIHYLRLPENVGSAAAANAGIAASYGKWIAPLDADDMMEPTRLERLYRAAIENPHRVIYDDYTAFSDSRAALEMLFPGIDADKRPIIRPRDGASLKAPHWVATWAMPEYDFDFILTKNGMHKGILFECQAWKEVGGYPENFNNGREDWAMNVALGERGYCGVHVKAPLYLGRRHGGNRTNTNGRREWHTYFVDKMRNHFPRLYAGERSKMCCGNKSNGNGAGAGASARMAARNGASASLSMGGARGRIGAMSTSLANIPGQSGFIKVEFMPNRSGTAQYVGAISRTTYVFGGKRKFGYVDERDIDALLKIMDGNRPAFRRVNDTPPSANDTPPVETRRIVITSADGTLTNDLSDVEREIDAPDAKEVARIEDEQTGGELETQGAGYSANIAISPPESDPATTFEPTPPIPAPKPKAPRKSVASKAKSKTKATTQGK